MIVTIHQPEHLPWLGYFNKMAKADIFVILDSVQFEKNNFQNRNRILGSKGAQWIGVPVLDQSRLASTIMDTNIATEKKPKWRKKYMQTIEMFYHKHPFFSDVYPIVETAISLNTEKVCDINLSMIYGFAEKLNIRPSFIKTSEMAVSGSKTELLLSICKKLNAAEYIAGSGGRAYMDLSLFSDAGIAVSFNDYHHPVYPQMRSTEFIPYLSSMDLFMNVGFSEAKTIIMAGNETTSKN